MTKHQGNPLPTGPPGSREEAVAAMEGAIKELDTAFRHLEPVRPFQAWRWEKESRALFLRSARDNGSSTEHLWELVADLRELLTRCRRVAEAELGSPDGGEARC